MDHYFDTVSCEFRDFSTPGFENLKKSYDIPVRVPSDDKSNGEKEIFSHEIKLFLYQTGNLSYVIFKVYYSHNLKLVPLIKVFKIGHSFEHGIIKGCNLDNLDHHTYRSFSLILCCAKN